MNGEHFLYCVRWPTYIRYMKKLGSVSEHGGEMPRSQNPILEPRRDHFSPRSVPLGPPADSLALPAPISAQCPWKMAGRSLVFGPMPRETLLTNMSNGPGAVADNDFARPVSEEGESDEEEEEKEEEEKEGRWR